MSNCFTYISNVYGYSGATVAGSNAFRANERLLGKVFARAMEFGAVTKLGGGQAMKERKYKMVGSKAGI